MANQNTENVNLKSESSNENGGNTPQQNNAAHGNQQEGGNSNVGSSSGGGGQIFGGGHRGGRGGAGRFGNRRSNMPNIKHDTDLMNRKRPMRGPIGPRNEPNSGPRSHDDRLHEKLSQIAGPSYDLAPLNTAEKKFSGRSRLYIGNIPNDFTEDDINKMFQSYGETSELFVNKEKNFGFIRLDFHSNAERAKRELDGSIINGRTLKIRFAPNGSSVKVKNLTPFVSNELLYVAFAVFGEVERAVIVVDDHGKPTGEGIVEYARKGSATHALKKCSESCFFLTSSLRPTIVEPYEALDDLDGHPEKNLPRKNPEYMKSREVGPRFANTSSFEHEYGMRWKQLHELYAQKEKALKKELKVEEEKLEAQMELARYEHETEMLREQLRARELDRDRQKHEWEMRQRQAEESRQRAEEQMRRQQDEMQARMVHQEEEMRRRQQENNLFMQAHQLDNMLDQQEQAYEQPNQGYNPGEGVRPNHMDPKQFMNNYDRNHRFDGRDMGQGGPRGGGNMGGRGHWVNENRGGGRDDYPNKRRRY